MSLDELNAPGDPNRDHPAWITDQFTNALTEDDGILLAVRAGLDAASCSWRGHPHLQHLAHASGGGTNPTKPAGATR